MTDIKRIQRRRSKGWKMPPNTRDVTRAGHWGNPWDHTFWGRDASVAMYRAWITGETTDAQIHERHSDVMMAGVAQFLIDRRNKLRERLPEIRGKRLACWCALDQPCHADVLLELANPALTTLSALEKKS